MKKIFKGLIFGLILSLVLPGVVSAHTIHFETYGGTTIPDIEVKDGDDVYIEQYKPTLDGYFFDGWCLDSSFNYYNYDIWPGQFLWNVKSDVTLYAYYYSSIYTYAYNKTTGEVEDYAGKIFINNEETNYGYNPFIVYEPYDSSTDEYSEYEKPGFKFVEWRVAYSVPTKNQLDNGYYGEEYSKATLLSKNPLIELGGGNGFITLYAVFEEDPESDVELITEARALVVEPEVGVDISAEVESQDPTKYTVTDNGCWTTANTYNCVEGKFEDGVIYEVGAYFTPQSGYRFGNSTKFYINDKLIDEEDLSTYGTAIFGEASFPVGNVPEPTDPEEEPRYTIVFDYNGGNSNGLSQEIYSWVGFVLIDSKENMMNGVTAPTGKVLDYLLINGKIHLLNTGIEINKDMTIKYVWTDAKKTLKQSSATTSSATIKWSKVSGAKGYFVQVNSGGKWKKIATITKGSTVSKTIKKLSAGKKYTYRVQAYKIVKGKKKAFKTTNIVTAVTKPGKPKISVSTSGSALVVSYKKVTGATKYEVFRSTKKTGKYKKVGTSTTTSYVDSNVIGGKTYYYKVRACNKYCGAYSNIAYKKAAK